MANLTRATSETYVRRSWGDAWTLIPFFDCTSAAFRVSPSMPTAELEWRFGLVMRRGEFERAQVEPLDYLGWFVKITITSGEVTIDWYGVLVEKETLFGGTSEGERYGVQMWKALGMEYLLARTVVTETHLADSNGQEYVIPVALGFNLGRGGEGAHELAGNRGGGSAAVGDRFDVDLVGGRWNLFTIARYLVEHFQPADVGGSAAVPFGVTAGYAAQQNMLLFPPPTLQAEGRTVKELLDQLCDRRRMLAWRCEVEEPNVSVIFENLLDQNIALPGNQGALAANEVQLDWELDLDPTIVECRLVESEIPRADEVIVRGERVTETTLLYYPDRLDRGWTNDEQTAYRAGASGEATYAALDPIAKRAANQRARNAAALRRVYRRFVIPPLLNVAGSGGNVRVVAAQRLLDRLPLKQGIDYSGAISDAKRLEHEESREEYRPPLALVRIDGGAYEFLDRPSRGAVTVRPEAGGRDWGAHLRMLDDGPGFEVQVHGEVPHVLALGDFAPIDTADQSESQPEIAWRDLSCTVCIELHGYCEGFWPVATLAGSPNAVKRLYVHVPNARLDLLSPGTILDLDASGNPITATGGAIRDDSPRLFDLARIAYEWYSAPRHALGVLQRRIPSTYSGGVGSIVRRIGNAPGEGESDTRINVGTMVTEIVYDLVRGTTAIKTDFAELDVARL